MIPANGKNTPVPERYEVQRYEVSEKGGLVWLWWGEKNRAVASNTVFLKSLRSSATLK